ncbi:hypothetical protein HZB01_04845 [Candidatus Woesearchaeota archaeon]|nr:hypothetical protein [Candidatus Woesearchaeota archaeon]
MSVWTIIIGLLVFLWKLFVDWLKIFIAPIHNWEMLWIIIPIWLAWFFSEFFQEKRGTSFGNAISNGVVVLWVGIDWMRHLVGNLSDNTLTFGWETVFKFILSLLTFTFGLFVIVEGIKGKGFIKFIGRSREVTYILLMFSPIVYGITFITWENMLSILLFFPVFYFVIELIDRWVPDPKSYEEDEERPHKPSSDSGFGDLKL